MQQFDMLRHAAEVSHLCTPCESPDVTLPAYAITAVECTDSLVFLHVLLLDGRCGLIAGSRQCSYSSPRGWRQKGFARQFDILNRQIVAVCRNNGIILDDRDPIVPLELGVFRLNSCRRKSATARVFRGRKPSGYSPWAGQGVLNL